MSNAYLSDSPVAATWQLLAISDRINYISKSMDKLAEMPQKLDRMNMQLEQLESQYIARVFEENPDIDIMYDFHNFNGTSAGLHHNLIWIAAYKGGQYVEHMVQKLVKQMTNHWRSKFTWIPQEDTWYAGYSDTTEGAMIKDYAAKTRGIPFTSIFEVGGRWWIDPTGVPYDLNHGSTEYDV